MQPYNFRTQSPPRKNPLLILPVYPASYTKIIKESKTYVQSNQSDPDEVLKRKLRKQFGKDLVNIEVDESKEGFIDQLGNILVAQLVAVDKILHNDFFNDKNGISQVDVKEKQAACIEKMEKVNDFNWQYLIQHRNGRETPINDMESMIIGKDMQDILDDASASKSQHLLTHNMTVNLYSGVVTSADGSVKMLVKAE